MESPKQELMLLKRVLLFNKRDLQNIIRNINYASNLTPVHSFIPNITECMLYARHISGTEDREGKPALMQLLV